MTRVPQIQSLWWFFISPNSEEQRKGSICRKNSRQRSQNCVEWAVAKSYGCSDLHHAIQNQVISEDSSKSVQGLQVKIDLSFWNMEAWGYCKLNRERVQVYATLRDRNLWIPQGRLCKKESYKLVSKTFAGFHWNRCRLQLQTNPLCEMYGPTHSKAVSKEPLSQLL